jgi:putative transposase
VREIQAFLKDMYAVDVSPDLISTVTDAVVAEVTAWQSRPLEPMYPVVFFDARRVKIRDEAVVRSKAVYVALAVRPDGTRDILGIWVEQTEGAKADAIRTRLLAADRDVNDDVVSTAAIAIRRPKTRFLD